MVCEAVSLLAANENHPLRPMTGCSTVAPVQAQSLFSPPPSPPPPPGPPVKSFPARRSVG